MKVDGEFKYNKAIKLTPQRIQQICDILLQYYDKLTFKCKTKKGRYIEFQTKDELLEYDNFSSGRIVVLYIYGNAECDSSFNRISLCFRINKPVIRNYSQVTWATFTLDSIEQKTEFIKALDVICKKSTQNYWLFGKVTLCLFLLATGIAYNLSDYVFPKKPVIFAYINSLFSTSLLKDLLIIFTVVLVFYILDKTILIRLFPPIVFYWGEEANVFDRNEKLRSNLFWVVFFGFVFCVAGPFLVVIFY